MTENQNQSPESGKSAPGGFFSTLLSGLARDLVKLVVAFLLGTGAGAIVCLYYGIPMGFSILGGILVLGIALALVSDSIFS